MEIDQNQVSGGGNTKNQAPLGSAQDLNCFYGSFGKTITKQELDLYFAFYQIRGRPAKNQILRELKASGKKLKGVGFYGQRQSPKGMQGADYVLSRKLAGIKKNIQLKIAENMREIRGV